MTTLNVSKLVKGSAAELPRLDLLKSPADSLLGVGGDIVELLREKLKIKTIFDLATSRFFNSALNVVAPQNDIAKKALQDGFVSGDILNQTEEGAAITPEAIGEQGIEKLRFNDSGTAAAIKEQLGIETIRDFALWTPFQTARALHQDTFASEDKGGEHIPSENAAPADLLPKSGNLASQKAYYQTTYVIDSKMVHEGVQEGASFDLGSQGQIDLLHTALNQEGFNEAAVGIRVLSEQAWYAEGVSLGKMIHSLSLAPGEVTRLAVTQWTQQTSGQRGESLRQREDLRLDTTQQMTISEITNSVAQEIQHGNNRTETESDLQQAGNSRGRSFVIFGSSGSSNSNARNNSVTTSVSRSDGTRNLSSQTNRNINVRTHQQADASRNRKSTVIQETRENEKEILTTRVVANYNHMHPLTMQYYEVVQNYRVATQAIDYERRIFVPIKLFNFKDPRVILRYRAILESLTTDEKIKERLSGTNESDWRKGHVVTLVDSRRKPLHEIEFTDPNLVKIDYKLQGAGFIDAIQLMFNDGSRINSGSFDNSGEASGSVFIDNNISLSQLSKVLYDPDGTQAGDTLTLTYHFGKNDKTDSYTQTITLTGSSYNYEAIQFQVVKKDDEYGAIQHLEENTLYYSQGIWLHMDSTDWMKALLTVTYKGKPIAPTIDPTPVAFLGNSVAFPWHFSDEQEKLDWLLETELLDQDFKTWQTQKGHVNITDQVKEEYLLNLAGEPHGDVGLKETLVPVSTGGVFAEAVLGRYNCAEKIDLTRFWNWQDSPIPIMPSEIDKLTAGGHKGAAELLSDLSAAGFDSEAIHVHSASPQAAINAAAASAQGSTDALIRTLTAANLFRDMSNAAATTDIGAQSIKVAEAGAKVAGEQSTENMKIASEQSIQQLQIIGDLAKQVLPLLAGSGTGGATSAASTVGAALNAADKVDQATQKKE